MPPPIFPLCDFRSCCWEYITNHLPLPHFGRMFCFAVLCCRVAFVSWKVVFWCKMPRFATSLRLGNLVPLTFCAVSSRALCNTSKPLVRGLPAVQSGCLWKSGCFPPRNHVCAHASTSSLHAKTQSVTWMTPQPSRARMEKAHCNCATWPFQLQHEVVLALSDTFTANQHSPFYRRGRFFHRPILQSHCRADFAEATTGVKWQLRYFLSYVCLCMWLPHQAHYSSTCRVTPHVDMPTHGMHLNLEAAAAAAACVSRKIFLFLFVYAQSVFPPVHGLCWELPTPFF